MPSLTVQYMSDSGTVELSRDCGEEGTRHIPCRGQRGAERETILSELRCIDEAAENLTTTSIPSTTTTTALPTTTTIPVITSTSTRQPEEQITSFATDAQTENMEDNTIPNLMVSTQHHIVHSDDLLMQADQPSPIKVNRPEDKRNKKAQINDFNVKKVYNLKKVVKKLDTSDEMMMGDQPLPYGLVPLPQSSQSAEELTKNLFQSTVAFTETTTQYQSTTPDARVRRQTEGDDPKDNQVTTSALGLTTVDELLVVSVGVSKHPHNKVDESVDHFVPPMLLVRTKFNATLTNHSTEESTEGHVQVTEALPAATTVAEYITEIKSTTQGILAIETSTESTEHRTEQPTISSHDSTTTPAASTPKPTVLPETTAFDVTSTTAAPRFRSPHAPQRQPDQTPSAEPNLTTDPHGMAAHLPHHIGQITLLSTGDTSTSTILYVTTTEPSPKTTTFAVTTNTEASGDEETLSSAENTKQSGEASSSENTSSSAEQLRTADPDHSSSHTTSVPKRVYGDLTNKENFQPYKPNRHRSLTKPETHTYIKKLFG